MKKLITIYERLFFEFFTLLKKVDTYAPDTEKGHIVTTIYSLAIIGCFYLLFIVYAVASVLDIVEKTIEHKVALPEQILSVMGKEKEATAINTYAELKKYLLSEGT